ncbi:MAG TPA: PAS domain S-box protein [Gemmatimonadales bacterium]|nr:PAS domain S-box protein [Gemmatimonadales bacterium]
MTHSLLLRPDRLAALRQTALLDTPPEEGFDRLTRMAARLLGAPISLISLVTDERQFFKSTTGLAEPWATSRTAPLSFSFCSTVAGTGEALVVEDARRHPLLRHSTALRELGWIAYAGVPLISREGHVLGSFCVVDRTPRLWSERDIALLQDLAASVITEIELRREMAQRLQAEVGHRNNEEELYNSFEHAGIGMALVSLDGRWVRVNRALADLLGTAADDLVGFSQEARTHPEDVAAEQEALRLLLTRESRAYTMEKRYVRSTGEEVWTLVTVSLVTGPGEQPSHLIVAVQDITDRKQAEADLRSQGEDYRLVLRQSGAAIRSWHLASDRLTWDRGGAPLLDYDWDALVETPDWWYSRIHAYDRERVVQSLDAAVSGGASTWSETYQFRKADNTYTLVEDRGTVVRDEAGHPVRVVAALLDASLAGRSQRINEILDALPIGVWLLDRQGHIVYANAASEAIWGPLPESLDQLSSRLSRVLEGEGPFTEEIEIEAPEGDRKSVSITAAPLGSHAGETTGAVVLSEDVTERKTQLAAEQSRTEQLQQGLRLEAVGRLAGGIAHDFNNLLTGILSYSDLILQELRPNDPLREDVEQIRDAGQRAAGLTRQLLAFSRRQLLRPQVVSINLSITELEPMLQRLLGTEVSLETSLDPELGNILIDPGQLEQALVNLVLNARDAMSAGGRLRLRTLNIELDGSSYVRLEVSDTGTGMDQETQARIFEPFFTTKHGGGGRGLGLATVYGVVEQSGGKISVESNPGEGATFTLDFPRYLGPEAAIGTAPQRVADVGSETLLLVEDEAAVRASVRRLLEWHGYTVLEARNGVEALQIYDARESEIDLVLTDILMPELGGHELVEQLRERRPDLRVVFMSGYAERALTSNGSVPRGTGYLEKPFAVETLMRRVREVLDA